jgi:GMP synthase PP-ATPase subunit
MRSRASPSKAPLQQSKSTQRRRTPRTHDERPRPQAKALRDLFKDEVRGLGRNSSIPHNLVVRHPFPGTGIATRVLGEEQAATARKADYIFIEEIKAAGLYDQISQAFAALLPIKAVGVTFMGDKRSHQQVLSLRAVQTTDLIRRISFVLIGI